VTTSQPQACAVCGHMLAHQRGSFGEVRWLHTQSEDKDHPPVPVAPSEIHPIIRCDFCLTEGAAWELPVASFTVGNHRFTGAWSACEICANFLTHDDWEELTAHAHRASEQRHTAPQALADFQTIYALLRAHITGPVRRTTP